MRAGERLGFLTVGLALGFAVGRLHVPRPKPVPSGKNPKLVAAGRRGIERSGMNTKRYRCRTCGIETTGGPLTRHQQATGHAGRERVA